MVYCPNFHGPIQVASALRDHFAAVTSNLSGSQSRLYQSPYAWKEFAAHLLGLNAPVKEPGFGFCQQHLEFPSSLPSKYYTGPMLLDLRVQMGTGASNMAWSADMTTFFIPAKRTTLSSFDDVTNSHQFGSALTDQLFHLSTEKR